MIRTACALLATAGCLTAVADDSRLAPTMGHSVVRAAATRDADPGENSPPEAGSELTEAELVTERYPEGSVKTQRWVTLDTDGNYVNHGTFKAYDKNGKLAGTGEYREGKEQGKWTRYFTSTEGTFLAQTLDAGFESPFISEAPLVDGKLHGTWTIRDRAGRIIVQWQFENGTRQGASTWWFSSGEKRSETTYKNGQIHGKFATWGSDHREAIKAVYFEGRKLTTKTDWHTRSQKLSEGSYLSPPEEIETYYDWWNCTIKTTRASQEGPGVKHGAWTYWHSNGKMKMQGEYKEDVPVGRFTWWYENGQKQSEGEYAAGRQTGAWLGWHPNGMKKYRGQYTAGAQTGEWMVWKADGRRTEVHDYGRDSGGDEQAETSQPLDESAALETETPESVAQEPDQLFR